MARSALGDGRQHQAKEWATYLALDIMLHLPVEGQKMPRSISA